MRKGMGQAKRTRRRVSRGRCAHEKKTSVRVGEGRERERKKKKVERWFEEGKIKTDGLRGGRGSGRLIDVEAIKVNGIDERICIK